MTTLEGEWAEYRLLVISELERIDSKVESSEAKILKKLDCLERTQRQSRDDIVALKATAATWGFIAGLVPAIAVFIMKLIK